jgi:CRISPR/Cas system CSM-associated protein Csm4 (group 5 of RAMP superfamily)
MTPALIVKFRPLGPWRPGPDSGARDRVDLVLHSDTLYSAVTAAMLQLGWLEEWLDATARRSAGPAVRFTSCFPYAAGQLFAAPPRSLWPPAVSPKVRWSSARFVPLSLVDGLLAGDPLKDDDWTVDGSSECLIPPGGSAPFVVGYRSSAAVDRLGGPVAPHRAACLEFAPGAGLWAAAAFGGEEEKDRWTAPVEAAFRLLADSGIGGERSRGWGRSEAPEFLSGALEELILPRASAASPTAPGESAEPAPRPWWLLSLFVPAAGELVDWGRGSYSILERGGRVESPAGSGALKKVVGMVAEGSVLVARGTVRGSAPDVAPDRFAHPVYRAGYAVALALPAETPA